MYESLTVNGSITTTQTLIAQSVTTSLTITHNGTGNFNWNSSGTFNMNAGSMLIDVGNLDIVLGTLDVGGAVTFDGILGVTGITTLTDDLKIPTAQLVIGGSTPNANSDLDLQSTTKGFLLTRMTTAQVSTFEGLLGAGDEGMFFWDSTANRLRIWDGTGTSDFDYPRIQVSDTLSVGQTSPPVSSSSFDVVGTTKGARPNPSMTEAQRDAIGSPAAGLTIYNLDTNQINVFNGSAWGAVAGSGGFGINYVPDPGFDLESGIGAWLAYADAAGTDPVDGTAGSPTVTCTRNTSTPLRGSGDLSFTKDAVNRQGEGCSINLTTFDPADSTDSPKKMRLEFDFDPSDADYVANDIGIFIFDVDNSQLIFPTTIDLPKTAGQIVVEWQSRSSADDYRLIFHQRTVSALDYSIFFDNIKISTRETVHGDNIGPWTVFTPTSDILTTSVTHTGVFRIVGDTIEVRQKILFDAANTDGLATFNLPPGFTINTAKLNNLTNFFPLGAGSINDGSVGRYHITVVEDSGDVRVKLLDDDFGTGAAYLGMDVNVDTSTNTPMTVATGDSISFYYMVPVNELETNTVLSNSRVEYACNTSVTDAADTTSFSNSSEGCTFPGSAFTAARSKRIRFPSPIQPTDHIWIEIDSHSTGRWHKMNLEDLAGNVTMDMFRRQVAVTYGFGRMDFGIGTASTDIDIEFGQYRALVSGSAYGAAGEAWDATSDDAKWRLVKTANPLAVQQSFDQHEIFVHTGNGHGSTDTKIRRFTTLLTNKGDSITHATSAAAGDSFTINRDGTYAITYGDQHTAGICTVGISVNADGTGRTTNIGTLTIANGKRIVSQSTANQIFVVALTLYLTTGDIIRAHTESLCQQTNENVNFRIVKTN